MARIIDKITVNRNYEITIRFFLTLDDFKRAFEQESPKNTCIEEAKALFLLGQEEISVPLHYIYD